MKHHGTGARTSRAGLLQTFRIRIGRTAFMTPYITDRPAAYLPAQGRNSHIPYGLYFCPDGSQVLHCRNYTPTWVRQGDGWPAQPVKLLQTSQSRWVEYQCHGYFFRRGNHPIGRRPVGRAVRDEIARGESILNAFLAGKPVSEYLIPLAALPHQFKSVH